MSMNLHDQHSRSEIAKRTARTVMRDERKEDPMVRIAVFNLFAQR
jgi:hypothetical protein